MAQTWLGSWEKRIELTIDSGDIDANLTDFPVLVHLSTSSGIGGIDVSAVFDELTADANRLKIAVTTSDGLTQCYVEIEKWDDANEQAWLWVKVPAVDSGTDTVLYLYYDVSQADNNTYIGDTNSVPAENVWDANYVAVYHMRDGADTSHIYDSTSSDYDGAKTAANNPIITTSGQIDGAQSFAGDDKVDCGDIGIDHTAGKSTLEFWDNQPILETGVPVNFGQAGGPDRLFNVGNYNTGDFSLGVVSSDGWQHLDFTVVAATWYRHTLVVDMDALEISAYQNKTAHGSNPSAFTGAFDNPVDFWLGEYVGGGGATVWFAGLLDEVRVSNITRTKPWLDASYESETDDLVAFGTEVVLTQAVWDFFTWA